MKSPALAALVLAVAMVPALGLGVPPGGSVPSTVPPPGIRENAPHVHVLTGATIVTEPGKTITNGVIVVRDGVIVAVGTAGGADAVTVPSDARVWNVAGKRIYPGFIDAYSEAGDGAAAAPAATPAPGGGGGGGRRFGGNAGSPAPTAGATYWNSRVTPEQRVARTFSPDREGNRTMRASGIVARLVAPSRGLIKGVSAVVDTGDEDAQHSILKEEVAEHVALQPGFRGFGGGNGSIEDRYPTSPMGAYTLVRQAILDAQWYASAWEAVGAHSSLPRPEHNDALAALSSQLKGHMPVIIDAGDELYDLRADRIGKEFDLPVIIRGSGQEYRLLDEVKKAGRPVIVPLAFPRPPAINTPEAAANVPLMDLMSWDLSPENPARLDKAGVKIAFTGMGLSGRDTYLSQVRRAVKRGLPEDSALKAMTTTPAELLGVSATHGTIAVGKNASFVVMDGDLFADRTKVIDTWVDGARFEVTAAPGLDVRGRWDFEIGTWKGPITFSGEDGVAVRAALSRTPGPGATSQPTSQPAAPEDPGLEPPALPAGPGQGGGGGPGGFRGARGGRRAGFGGGGGGGGGGFGGGAGFGGAGGAQGDIRGLAVSETGMTFTIRGEAVNLGPGTIVVSLTVLDGRAIGTALMPDGTRQEIVARKAEVPVAATRPAATRTTTGPSTQPATFQPNFPLGDFGRDAAPAQPHVILFRDATVWTSESDGVIEHGSVLVTDGKITGVFGSNVKPEVPGDVTTVNCSGKHLTAGVIDCHSHMATDGGVNESGQTITCEVRIGDFIDPTDISIYRQLAGGVTSSNILHGSANTIGGQNQVIKLRWGMGPEQCKFAGAPEGVKFALGENPKQSNWGAEASNRYPQSRMGVEQLVRDEFAAAKAYRAAQEKFKADPASILPPRRDLELDAVAEILEHKRWIHCHCYRQDEILSLIRTTQDYGVTIGSLQHILEGYKLADVLAKGNITASGFTDWWAYKIEVIDAIPYNMALMYRQGVVCSFNSDDAELGRRLYLEAGKAVKYGEVPPAEAWKMVTLNPAKSLRIDDKVGSIKPGKDADLVVWSTNPMSNFTRCEQTWIDGRLYFSRDDDVVMKKRDNERRAKLIQKILTSGEEQAGPGDALPTPAKLWPNYDEYDDAATGN